MHPPLTKLTRFFSDASSPRRCQVRKGSLRRNELVSFNPSIRVSSFVELTFLCLPCSCYAYQFHAMQNYAITNHLTSFISMQNCTPSLELSFSRHACSDSSVASRQSTTLSTEKKVSYIFGRASNPSLIVTLCPSSHRARDVPRLQAFRSGNHSLESSRSRSSVRSSPPA